MSNLVYKYIENIWFVNELFVTLKSYSTFHQCPRLEPHHQIVKCDIQDTCWWGNLIKNAVSVFFNPQPTELWTVGWISEIEWPFRTPGHSKGRIENFLADRPWHRDFPEFFFRKLWSIRWDIGAYLSSFFTLNKNIFLLMQTRNVSAFSTSSSVIK